MGYFMLIVVQLKNENTWKRVLAPTKSTKSRFVANYRAKFVTLISFPDEILLNKKNKLLQKAAISAEKYVSILRA
jgi:hypothetical protein